MYMDAIDLMAGRDDDCYFPDDDEIESPRYDYRPCLRKGNFARTGKSIKPGPCFSRLRFELT